MRAALLSLVLVALVLGAAASAKAAAGAVDVRAEIAAALFAASATQAAVEKATDAKLSAQQAQINALAAKVRAGEAKQAQLTEAQEGFVAQLAAKDRAYGAAIDAFRGAVTHITETPEGAAALARFNAGDEQGALSILDQLNDARDTALEKATNIQKAVGRRDEAELALEARDRGKLDTSRVIALFHQVVTLDPGVQSDWLSLARLYTDVGQLADAKQAALSAVSTAADDQQKATADIALGDALLLAGTDPQRIVAAYEEAAKIRSAYYDAHNQDAVALHNAEQSLERMARILAMSGKTDVAKQVWEKLLGWARHAAAADPTNAKSQRDVSVLLGQVGDLADAAGDAATALKDYQEALGIARKLAAADPSNASLARELVICILNVGDLDLKQQDSAGARGAYLEARDIATRLATNDPSNLARRRDLIAVNYRLAAISAGVSCAEAVSQMQALAAVAALTGQEQAALAGAQACAAKQAPAAQP